MKTPILNEKIVVEPSDEEMSANLKEDEVVWDAFFEKNSDDFEEMAKKALEDYKKGDFVEGDW